MIGVTFFQKGRGFRGRNLPVFQVWIRTEVNRSGTPGFGTKGNGLVSIAQWGAWDAVSIRAEGEKACEIFRGSLQDVRKTGATLHERTLMEVDEADAVQVVLGGLFPEGAEDDLVYRTQLLISKGRQAEGQVRDAADSFFLIRKAADVKLVRREIHLAVFLPNQRSMEALARVTCSSLMGVATRAVAAAMAPKSSVNPTIGVISGMASKGMMK